MNAVWTNRRAPGLTIGLLLSMALPILAESPTAPAIEPQFKPGDILAIAAERAQVMLGAECLGTLPHGQRIVVVQAEGAWIGTQVSVGGQSRSGWVHVDAIVPSGERSPAADFRSPAGLQGYSAFRPAAAESVQPAPANMLLQVSAARGGGEVWDSYMAGKYDRHELDPNLHTWEPWRHR